MARKNPLKCSVGSKRFTVIRVNGDTRDTHAGRNFEEALRAAQPDRGARLEIFVTCARDPGEARNLGMLAIARGKQIKHVKTIRYKRGG
jgi:hypothetical protein